MTAPASSPRPPVAVSPCPSLPSLYPCPHLPGKLQITIRGCEANREFVRAILSGEKIRVNNHPVFKDKEMALGLKHVCRDCPGILEVNGMKAAETPAVTRALQVEAPPQAPPSPPEVQTPPAPEDLDCQNEPKIMTEIMTEPAEQVSAPPPPPDPVLDPRWCKNHPDRSWHKNTGLCLECNRDRLKTSANSPTAKLPHEREKNRIILDFNGGREDLLEWFKTYAADQLRTPEAQLMYMVKSLSGQGPELLLTTNH